jgi:hypothetical protein
LAITPIVPRLASQIGSMVVGTTENSAALFEQNMSEILGSYNLFSALSTWPLGAPSLVAGSISEAGPLGTRITIGVHSTQAFLAVLLALVLAGLLVGCIYLSFIARYVGDKDGEVRTWAGRVWLDWVRIVALAFAAVVVAFVASVPLFLIVEFSAMIMASLASFVLLAGAAFGMWGLFHLFFAAHGILLDGLGVGHSVSNSVAVVRQNRSSAVGLLLVAVVIGLGLTKVWSMPPSESWMHFIAIIGNAFVNTGLVAATFVYYRERTETRSTSVEQ